jgi:nitronate monooxygenase
MLESLKIPIIQAPMAGGVSTPELVAAVSKAGGLGFLAAGYKTAQAVKEEIAAVRRLTRKPFGVNLFVPGREPVDQAAVIRYRRLLETESRRFEVSVGDPLFDDDGWDAKLEVLLEENVPVASFTFGCPSPSVTEELKRRGTFVIVTVTTHEEAHAAAEAGADALCVQGMEAGGHRATFHNHPEKDEDVPLLTLLSLVRQAVDLPVIAAGGIMNGRDVAAVLAAGASAAQLGTAFLRCPESGAHPLHKAALADPRFASTKVTRAFTGRRARGLVNRFMLEHGEEAPAAYPHVHYMTREIRKAAGQAGDPDAMSLWAGMGYRQAREMPAEELVRMLWREACERLKEAGGRRGC